jgi:hypothetical protein
MKTKVHILFGLALLSMFSACATYSPKQFTAPLQFQSDEYVNLQMRYISRADLEDQAGRGYISPFIVPPNTLDTREFVVLEFIIKNKSSEAMVINLPDVELQTKTGNYYPKNSFQLKQFWEKFDVVSTKRARMYRQIDTYLFDSKIRIPSDGLKRGYFVIYAPLAKYGEFAVKVPVLSAAFKFQIYEFTYEYVDLDMRM